MKLFVVFLSFLASALALNDEPTKFLALINAYRAQSGLAALQVSAPLQDAAMWMAYDSARRGAVGHVDSAGRSPTQRVPVFGYATPVIGENAAGGYDTADAVFAAWKASAGHNANILNPNWRVIGIGRAAVPGTPHGWYWVTDFGAAGDVVIGPDPTPPAPPANTPTCTASAIVSCFAGRYDAGTYVFTVSAPYGFRLYLDGQLTMDRWGNYPPTTYRISRTLSAGDHVIKIEHYSSGGTFTVTH